MAFLACADMVHKSVLLGNSNEINVVLDRFG